MENQMDMKMESEMDLCSILFGDTMVPNIE